MDEKIIIDINLALAETEIRRIEYLINRYVKKLYNEHTFSTFQENSNKVINLQMELNLWFDFKRRQLKSNKCLTKPNETNVSNEIGSFDFVKSDEFDFQQFQHLL